MKTASSTFVIIVVSLFAVTTHASRDKLPKQFVDIQSVVPDIGTCQCI